MNIKEYKIIVYVPESHADKVREAMGKAGAGVIGNYTNCTFTIKGVGRFLPMEGANPTQGKIGKLETRAEDRIETVCKERFVKAVIAAVRAVHPDEEPAMDVYPIALVD